MVMVPIVISIKKIDVIFLFRNYLFEKIAFKMSQRPGK